jgi:hypothetical protein
MYISFIFIVMYLNLCRIINNFTIKKKNLLMHIVDDWLLVCVCLIWCCRLVLVVFVYVIMCWFIVNFVSRLLLQVADQYFSALVSVADCCVSVVKYGLMNICICQLSLKVVLFVPKSLCWPLFSAAESSQCWQRQSEGPYKRWWQVC